MSDARHCKCVRPQSKHKVTDNHHEFWCGECGKRDERPRCAECLSLELDNFNVMAGSLSGDLYEYRCRRCGAETALEYGEQPWVQVTDTNRGAKP